MICEFCELYEQAKVEAKHTKEEIGVETRFEIKLQEYEVKDGKRKGSLLHRGMKLIYCPICKRKLSEVPE